LADQNQQEQAKTAGPEMGRVATGSIRLSGVLLSDFREDTREF
jgi:hypothetical protein